MRSPRVHPGPGSIVWQCMNFAGVDLTVQHQPCSEPNPIMTDKYFTASPLTFFSNFLGVLKAASWGTHARLMFIRLYFQGVIKKKVLSGE